ncbi:MAG: hypothetical protein IT330_03505 [Anaerolineae bacterium]|nr:hypothetical protein [Anaerolineae bacterium]
MDHYVLRIKAGSAYSSVDAEDVEPLRSAVENLYAVFARYPLREHVEGCEHCVYGNDHEQIHARLLRELTSDDLSKFSWKALTTWGTVDDFKHFLPRLLELMAFEGLEVPGYKFSLAEWHTWPQDEQQAVEAYFVAWWRFALASFPPEAFYEIDDCLCAIGQVIDDLEPYVDFWRGRCDGYLPALLHLTEFINWSDVEEMAQGGELSTASWSHWKERPTQMKRVFAWLLEPATLEVLRRSIGKPTCEPFRNELSEAMERLKMLRAAREGVNPR